MAHVKVVRRSMRPEEWTDLRFVWLQRGIYEEKFEIQILRFAMPDRFQKINTNIILMNIVR